MIHTRNATLIHFKQSKLSAEYIIHLRKKGIGLSYRMFVQVVLARGQSHLGWRRGDHEELYRHEILQISGQS